MAAMAMYVCNNIILFLSPLCRRSMVEGAQKRKTLRLMTIIIVMFLLCHLPKVVSATFPPLTFTIVMHVRGEGSQSERYSWLITFTSDLGRCSR